MSLVHKFRAARFRPSAAEQLTDDVLLPPPLPLIHLPDEPRRARSGALDGRPMHLPVRTHFHPETRSFPPESILIENRLPIEPPSPDDDNDTAPVERLRVYEYNRPHVFQQSGAAPDTLAFDSLFEGGNLQYADRVLRSDKAHAYELYVHPDLQNSAYRQWFYFDVRNATRGITYHFSLVNLAKSGALFGAGLQPCVYSEIDAAKGWVHAGSQVHYEASTVVAGTNTLHFQYEFRHDHDCVAFACLQPYSYTDLVEYLDALERDPRRSAFVRRTELCQTIAQNPCDLLSITSAPSASGDSLPLDDKRLIVLSARVHPGEPNASWMMKGMLDYLTGASSGAAVLRNHFVFKVVPMLNPDGVINGNTRVNLAGWDLNRKWSNPIEKLFPTVFHLKRLLTQWQLKDRVAIYCDLHGHSINRNIFTYGCCTGKRASKKPTATAIIQNDPRVFPMLVARNSDFFSFASCDFKVVKSKLNTARVVVHHELGVVNSYTLEASFCGPDFGARKDTQFSTWDLEEMGRSWCQSLLIYYGLLPLVRELDQRKEQDEAQVVRQETCSHENEGLPLASPEDAALLELQGDLLRDCEAAISELFASVDLMDDSATTAARDSCDSDLSGAEDAIPPNDAPDGSGGNVRVSAVSRKAVANGYASAPEEYSRDKATAKKIKRRQSTRRKKSAASCGSSKPLGKKKTKHRSRRRRDEQLQDPEEDGGGGHDETGTAEMPGSGESGTDDDRSAKRKKKRKKKKPKHARRRPDKTPTSRGHRRRSASEAVVAAADEEDTLLAPTHSVLPDVPGSSSSSSRIPKAPSPPPTSDDPHATRLELPVATASHQPRCLSSRGIRKYSTVATEPLELPPLAGAATTSHPDSFRTGGSGRDHSQQKIHRDPTEDDDGDSSSPSGSSDDASDPESVVSEF